MVMENFRFIDLCAGIGGLRIPFDEIGGSCVLTAEIDSHARETYSKNFRDDESHLVGDLTAIDPHAVPEFDLLVAGFPCQPFSHAGKRLGFEDTRGTVFFSMASILAAQPNLPKVVLLENVRGLRNHDSGNTLKRILETLVELGYTTHTSLLNARDFGLPQNRQRLFIIGIRADIPDADAYQFPAPTHDRDSLTVSSILESDPSPDLQISERLWQGHQKRKLENTKNGKGFGFQLVTPNSNYTATLSARYYKDGSEILVSDCFERPRLLSKREAARLQGFPEGFVFHNSKKQAYKQFGNAVPVNVVRALAVTLKPYLGLEN